VIVLATRHDAGAICEIFPCDIWGQEARFLLKCTDKIISL